MYPENQDNSATTVKQPQKSQKEKTKESNQTNAPGQIDVTQPLTQEEQAIIMQSSEDETVVVSSLDEKELEANKETSIEVEPKKEEEKKKGYISSYVGDCVSEPEKGKVANLGNDVAFVQQHLNRLGILTDESFEKEKPTTDKEIDKSKIPLTIEAIEYFQEKILGNNKFDGEVWPGNRTIKNLATMTVGEKNTKYIENLLKEVNEKVEELANKAKKAREAEIERIKKEPPTKENVEKLYKESKSIERFGKVLKDYAIYNPKFVLKAFDLMEFGEPDNLTRAIMYELSDSEIVQLSVDLDTKFYEALDVGWTEGEEYALMAKLKAGKKPEEGNKEEKEQKVSKGVKDEAAKDLQTVRGIVIYQLQGSVGGNEKSKAVNNTEDVKQTAAKLKEKKYTVTDKSLEKGEWDTEFRDAIGKFQKDNKLVKKDGNPDYIISVGYGTYKALFDYEQYSSGLEEIYGKSDTKLNKKLDKDDAKLDRLDRDLEYDSKTKKNVGSFEESETIEKDKYNKSIEKIGEDIGVKKKDDEAKILEIVDKALASEEYFNEFTGHVLSELELSKKSIGSNSVNPLLEYRLMRYHKLMVAIGLFSGKMTGSACRDETISHQWSIYHSWKMNEHISTIKTNIIEMYNKELKPNGEVCVDKNGTVKDLDGNIWAKKEHFKIDDKGKATELKDTWDTYMDTISQSRVTKNDDKTIKKDWRLEHAAEGYDYNDERRYPMPEDRGHGRSKHITGDAIDINYGSFTKMNDAMNDLIALRFGLIRPVSGEQWHFEITNIEFTAAEKELTKKTE